MATSGALGGFLSAMLELRSQRLKEAEAKAKAQSEMMSGIGEGLGSLGKGIGAAIKQGREDKSSNELAQRYFGSPRAIGVEGQPQWDPQRAAKLPGEFTGGKEGLNQLIELEKMRGDIAKGKAADIWRQRNYDLAKRNSDISAGRAVVAARAAELKARNDAFEGMSKRAQEIYKDSEGYLKSATGIRKDLETALEGEGDQATFNQRATELMALNSTHKGRKLTVPLVDVPAFFPKGQQKLLDEYIAAQQAREAELAAKGAPATSGIFGGESPKARTLREATEEVAPGSQEALKRKIPGLSETPGMSMPLSAAPRYAPPNTPLPADLINRAAQGGQVSPAEYQQIAGQPPPAAAGPAPAPRPAPGAGGPIIYKNKKTGERGVWNYQTGKVDPLPAGQ